MFICYFLDLISYSKTITAVICKVLQYNRLNDFVYDKTFRLNTSLLTLTHIFYDPNWTIKHMYVYRITCTKFIIFEFYSNYRIDCFQSYYLACYQHISCKKLWTLTISKILINNYCPKKINIKNYPLSEVQLNQFNSQKFILET